jgi:hypothetical protein
MEAAVSYKVGKFLSDCMAFVFVSETVPNEGQGESKKRNESLFTVN